jgi:Tfp pilus tip-associated adhesin PilY1
MKTLNTAGYPSAAQHVGLKKWPLLTSAVRRYLSPSIATTVALTLFTALSPMRGMSAVTDLARQPLTSGASGQVKPNIMLMLDTSISMSWGHMPDEMEVVTGKRSVGYKSYQCNSLYYNPNTKYTLPKKADGSSFPVPSFTSAPYDGYDASLGTTNLNTSFQAYVGLLTSLGQRDPKSTTQLTTSPGSTDINFVDTPTAAYYYVFTGNTGPAPASLPFDSARCKDIDTNATKSATGGGTWTRSTISSAQQVNFAIWYSYYRTRLLLSKSSVSLAFSPLSDNYRVGFITVLPRDPDIVNSPVLASKYQPIADFGSAQKTAWFSKLFDQKPGFSSPTKEGLARVGRHYAGRQDGINAGMTGDPVQYSCQPNFTIMTTDGYWNTFNESAAGGGVKIDGTTLVGQQDGTPITPFPLPDPFPNMDPSQPLPADYLSTYRLTPYPMFDGGANQTIVTRYATNDYSLSPCTSNAFFVTYKQQSRATNIDLRQTRQVLQTTSQMRRSTTQNRQGIRQQTALVTQQLQTRLRRFTTTTQSTATQQTTVRNVSSITALTYNQQIRTIQNRQTTQQTLADTRQRTLGITRNQRDVSQFNVATTRIDATTVRYTTSTYQVLRNTRQTRETKTQTTKTETTNRRVFTTTTRSTATFRYWDLQGEAPFFANACPNTANPRYICSGVVQGVTLGSITTGPELVASCTNATGNINNSFITTTCVTSMPQIENTPTGDVCQVQSPSSTNGFKNITCTAMPTINPTFVTSCSDVTVGSPRVSCNTATLSTIFNLGCMAGTGTNAIITSCVDTINTSVPQTNQSCTGVSTQMPSSANDQTSITCVQTAPSASIPLNGTCVNGAITTGAAPSNIQSTCAVSAPTTNAVASCSLGQNTTSPFIRTTACDTVTVSPTVTAGSCTPGTNSTTFVTTVCTATALAATNQPIATACVASAANANPRITCPNTPITVQAPAFSASCTPGTVTASTSPFNITACTEVTRMAQGISGTCSLNRDLGNAEIITFCPTAINRTDFIQGTCTTQTADGMNGWTTLSCPAAVGPGAVAGQTITLSPSFVATCNTIAATAGNNWLTTECPRSNVNSIAVATCVAGVNNTPPAPAVGPLITECTPNATVSTNMASQAACAALPGTSASQIVSCVTTPLGTVGVQAGTCFSTGPNSLGSASNSWAETTACPTPTSVEQFVTNCPATQTANALNQWIGITCTNGPNNTTNVPVMSCTPQTPGPAPQSPSWTRITCPTSTRTTGVQEPCNGGNIVGPPTNFETVTTCNTLTDTIANPTPVQTCMDETASASNGWLRRQCSVVNSPATNAPPIFVDPTNCPNPPAQAPDWITTTCTPVPLTANVAVDPTSCAIGGTTGPSPNFTRTTCVESLNPTMPVAVARNSCSNQAPSVINGWTETKCTTNNTPDTPIPPSPTCVDTDGLTSPFVQTICTNRALGKGTNGVNPVATCPISGPTDTDGNRLQTATSMNGQEEIRCTRAPGQIQSVVTSTSTQTQTFSSGVRITDSGISTPVAGMSTEVDGICYANNPSAGLPTLTIIPDGIPGTGTRPLNPTPPGNCKTPNVWPCELVVNGDSGGKANTLADVAQYYYVTDLRTPALGNNVGALGTDVSLNNVPTKGKGIEDDRAPWQHMTTFAIGLGVSGALNYSPTYKTDKPGDIDPVTQLPVPLDYYNIKNNTPSNTDRKDWPLPPDNGDSKETIDDFWHAAVNGRGQFFSAKNAQDVVSGVQNVLSKIAEVDGSGAAAASSTQQPVTGNNFAYLASYTSSIWIGDLEARRINLSTGEVQSGNIWPATANQLLDGKRGSACDNRRIMVMRPSTSTLANFTFETSACDSAFAPTGAPDNGLNAAERAFFDSTVTPQLTQFLSMTDGSGTPATVDQRTAAAGANLVNYLRGQKLREGFLPNTNQLYRTRDKGVLGALINAQPIFVQSLPASYSDAGYRAFNDTTKTRTPIVYTAANDGMLHAFYAGSSDTDPLRGQEAWAVIPSTILPSLAKQADRTFGANFQYTVDGTPTIGDAYDTTNAVWKTLLIGGYNAGGKGYYALDITDPVNPKYQWELKWSDTCWADTAGTNQADCHLGFSFGNPVLTKLASGRWVVMVTSGYNNINTPAKSGDGVGYLYILDAFSGRIIEKISTGEGNATEPSGLNRIANFVDNTLLNNTTRMVYGGDLLGNVWRFDVNSNIAPSTSRPDAVKLGVVTGANGAALPISTKPELAELNGKPIVFVGTGRLLGATDLTNTQKQSVFAIVDTLPVAGTNPLYANLRSVLAPITITQSGGTSPTRTNACTGSSALCAATSGWFTDLVDSGERVNIDMKLQLGTLVFATNVPQGTACNIGGYSYLNFVNYSTGLAVTASQGLRTGERLSNSVSSNGLPSTSLAVGFNFFQLPDGTVGGFVTGSDGKPIPVKPPITIAPPVGKRISWREVVQ